MPDFINKFTGNDDFLKKGLALSEEFALLEGRRPRILIGQAVDTLAGSMNKLCNNFADMGFDVDISPKLKEIKKLSTQSLENDTDMILVFSDNCISYAELLDFQNCVLSNQPYMMLSLFVRDPNCKSILEEHLKQWELFDEKASEYLIGYNLLNHLLSRS